MAATVLAFTGLSVMAQESPGKGLALEAAYTSKPVKLTGKLDDPAWRKAKPITFYSASTGKEPISKTEARVLWDDKYLYIGYKAYDKDIYSLFTQRDDNVCRDDALEVFFKTDTGKEPYYNFEVNVLGTVLDMFTIKKGAGGYDLHRWLHWDCPGLKIKTFVKGTLNNPYDIDEYWQLEVAIPFPSLPTLNGKTPKPGDKWEMLLSRYDWSVYLPDGVELSTCNTVITDDYHDASKWLPLTFTK